MDRRNFLKGCGTIVLAGAGLTASQVKASSDKSDLKSFGVLVDTTQCIGCRKCEWACNQAHDFIQKPIEFFDPEKIEKKIHSDDTFTVVNRFHSGENNTDVFVKTQCFHCLKPACYSACLVSAFHLGPGGAVQYDDSRCMGCRYCMVACPFEVPTFEYDDAVSPRIRKCDFCADLLKTGKVPACVDICPVQCLTFGDRSDLIKRAHDKIRMHPDRYVNHIFGEHELGGTRWMYLSSQPFEQINFQNFSDKPAPELVESIQHNVFKHFLAPGLLGIFLAVCRWNLKDHDSEHDR